MPKPFRYLEPTFFSGLFDDPLLLIRVRPTGRALLFDCGKVHHLAKRVFTSIDAVFISHAHMDHFMGMDSVIRHSHASPRTIDVFGPPGISDRMANKFGSYNWNLAETFWGNFRVSEVCEGKVASTLYSGPDQFVGRSEGERAIILTPVQKGGRGGYLGDIYGNRFLTVKAALCEHRIDVLTFKITEGDAFGVDDAAMAREGVMKGAWLRDLERLFHAGTLPGTPIIYPAQVGELIEERREENAEALYLRINKKEKAASIGYVTDVGYSEENLERLTELVGGVSLLVCECAFLAEDKKKADLSRHLCTTDLNMVLDRLRPSYVLPMHLSKSYQGGQSYRLYEEIDPPQGVTVLRIPERVTPRPVMASEIPKPE